MYRLETGSVVVAQRALAHSPVVLAFGALERFSVVMALKLSCSVACGIFLHQGWSRSPLHLQVGSFLSTVPPGSLVIHCTDVQPVFLGCTSWKKILRTTYLGQVLHL